MHILAQTLLNYLAALLAEKGLNQQTRPWLSIVE